MAHAVACSFHAVQSAKVHSEEYLVLYEMLVTLSKRLLGILRICEEGIGADVRAAAACRTSLGANACSCFKWEDFLAMLYSKTVLGNCSCS